MNLQLENKTALVTGSSQGIGFAIAEALGREGATVVINSKNQELVEGEIEKLSKLVPGIRAIAAVVALTDPRSTVDLVRKMPAVDILVNSVGFYVANEFQDISDQEWDEIGPNDALELYEWSTSEPSVSARNEGAQLGTHHLHLQRIRRHNSTRNDPLRSLEGRSNCSCERSG
jgi:hypothetical protein